MFRVMIKFKNQQRSRRTRGMSNQSWIELCTFPLAESSIGELWHAVASHRRSSTMPSTRSRRRATTPATAAGDSDPASDSSASDDTPATPVATAPVDAVAASDASDSSGGDDGNAAGGVPSVPPLSGMCPHAFVLLAVMALVLTWRSNIQFIKASVPEDMLSLEPWDQFMIIAKGLQEFLACKVTPPCRWGTV